MGIFGGGEKYSKEALDKAIETVKKEDVPFKESPEDYTSRDAFERGIYGHYNLRL